MDYSWTSASELEGKLISLLDAKHPGLVTKLILTLEGDTVLLQGEVASEDCKGDAKRYALAFPGVFKVKNLLIVAAFLQTASDDDVGDFFTKSTRTRGVASRGGRPQGGVRPIGRRSAGGQTEIPGHSLSPQPAGRTGGASSTSMTEVMRHPSITAIEPVSPGVWLEISVDLSNESRAGAAPIPLGSFPSDWETIDVSVQLIAPWASQIEILRSAVTVVAGGSSQPATFRALVSLDYVSGTPAQVHVVFSHGTRICGYASQDLAEQEVEATQPEPAPAAQAADEQAPLVQMLPDAVGPTVSVTIIAGTSGQTWVWKAAMPGGADEGTGQIHFDTQGKAFAESLLASCPDLKPNQFRRTMRGVGEELWRAAPHEFREAYHRWRTKIGSDFPIQFVTADPHIPWEMMKPDSASIDHLFLEHPVARWPLERLGFRRNSFATTNLLSFVPEYAGSGALAGAKQEGEWICATFAGSAMPPTTTAFFKVLDGEHPDPVGVLHFAGHGQLDTGINDGGIHMQDGTVSVKDIHQEQVVLGERDGTLMLLNACETAAGAQMLGMNTGWGAAIAARKFGGLIAPLWEVQDDVALEMMRVFLPPLLDGSASLGQALAIARKANSERSIAAFAYVAHGDVMAKFPLRP